MKPTIKTNERGIKILLIAPKYTLSSKVTYNYLIPMGLAYISAVLKKANYDVSCLNLNHRDGLTNEIVKTELDKKKYDIVATGHVAVGYSMIESILKTAREHPSNPKTILGGAIITSEPKLMFESLKPDFGVLGEGEVTILELLNSIEKKKDFKKVNGIMYRNNAGEIITTFPRKPIKNIDKIPFPDYEGFEFEEKLNNTLTNVDNFGTFNDYPRIYQILASRGCPFHCTFCYHTLGEEYRARSMGNVIKEIEFAIDKYRINSVALLDDLFSYNKERIYDFCEQIKRISKMNNKKIIWSCQLSVFNVDRNLLRTMKASGCEIINYGFESYSEDVLKSMRKPINPQQIDKIFKMTLEEKINVQANFIFGDIAETTQTAKETLCYWKKNCKEQVNLSWVQPYPGSKLYEYCLKKGLIKNKLDFIKNKLFEPINMTSGMSNKEYAELINTINKINDSLHNEVIPLYVKRKGNRVYEFLSEFPSCFEKNAYNKVYEVLSKCPFCSKKNLYKNFYLQRDYIYSSYLCCRNCNMRYSIVSPLVKILRKLNLRPAIQKIYYNLLKKRNF